MLGLSEIELQIGYGTLNSLPRGKQKKDWFWGVHTRHLVTLSELVSSSSERLGKICLSVLKVEYVPACTYLPNLTVGWWDSQFNDNGINILNN